MRSHALFDSLVSLETLDLRLSPSSLSLGAAAAASAVYHIVSSPADHTACPDDDPPITYPELPPTGPVGPGSSS